MLGQYVIDRPIAGLGFLGQDDSSGFSWGDLTNTIVGGVLKMEEAKLRAKQNKELIKQQSALERLRNAGSAGGMTMDEGMKWAMMIGIPAVGLLVFALILKGRK